MNADTATYVGKIDWLGWLKSIDKALYDERCRAIDAESKFKEDEDSIELADGEYYEETNVYFMSGWFYYHTTSGSPRSTRDSEAIFPSDYAKCTESELETILHNLNDRFFVIEEDQELKEYTIPQIDAVIENARWVAGGRKS